MGDNCIECDKKIDGITYICRDCRGLVCFDDSNCSVYYVTEDYARCYTCSRKCVDTAEDSKDRFSDNLHKNYEDKCILQ
jgi:hypothetical protein